MPKPIDQKQRCGSNLKRCGECRLLYDTTYDIGNGVSLCRGCTIDLRQYEELLVEAEVEVARHFGQQLANEFYLVVGEAKKQRKWVQYSDFEREMIQNALNKPIRRKRKKAGIGATLWTDEWSKKWTRIRDVDTNCIE